MIEVSYRLQPDHLKTYRILASKRVAANSRNAGEGWGLWLLYAFAAAVLLAAASLLLSILTGLPVVMPELLLGFVCGVAMSYILIWWHYAAHSRRAVGSAVRSHGPTLIERRCSVGVDGLRSGSTLGEAIYRWAAFDGLTVQDGVIVLWMEPGAGVLLPRSAFAGPEAETAFLGAVEAHLAAAKGSGSSGQAFTAH
jgi:hypothetical protein